MKISVIIPTYNRYKLLTRAIESIISQTLMVDEIIVVDDGSTDNTKEIVNDFTMLTYIYQENAGVSTARNRGIREASNDWIAFLDSDDEWVAEKMQRQVDFHRMDSTCLVSYTDEIWIRNGSKIKIPKKFKKLGKNTFLENISYCNIAPSSVLINRIIFDDIGFFDINLDVCEDYDLWLRIALKYVIKLIDKKLIKKYAGHDNQLSCKYWGMDRFRVLTLQKLLFQNKYKYEIEAELEKKYILLIKGAKKHKREKDIKFYTKKLRDLD